METSPLNFKGFPAVGRTESIKSTLSLLNDYEQRNLLPQAPIIVETGTTRGKFGGGAMGDGWATLAWGWFVTQKCGMLYTIDNDENNINECMKLTREYADRINYMTGDSLYHLKFLTTTLAENISLLYLDSLDSNTNTDEEQHSRACQHQLKEVQIIIERMAPHGLILLDDVPEDYYSSGKSSLSIPFLLDLGWSFNYYSGTKQMLLFKR